MTESRSLTFTVPGKPVPASRPVVTRVGPVYYKEPYNSWRVGAKVVAQSAASNAGWVMLTEPCRITVWAYGSSRNQDMSNILKACEDVAQAAGLVKNDNLFDEVRAYRCSLAHPHGPLVMVTIREGL